MAAQLKLWYFFEGKNAFSSVKISRDEQVDELRMEIHKQWCHGVCKDLDPGHLVLLKVDINHSKYLGDISELQAPDGAPVIDIRTLIQDLWPNQPTRDEFQICVRISIEPPSKRARTEDDENIFFAGPFGTISPSTIAKLSEFSKVQERPRERVANDRPYMDADHLPIALLYRGFGRFLDVTSGPLLDNTPEIDIKWRTFEARVNEFIDLMSEYHDDEIAPRNDIAVKCLNEIFACCTGNHCPLMRAVVRNKCISGGQALGPLMTIEILLEVKNELVGTGADPTIEICAYYTQSLLAKYPQVETIPRFLFPALGIVIMGSQIGFYALALEQRTRLVALTPWLPTTAENGNDWVRPTLLKAFKAAFVLRHHISEDSKNFSAFQTRLLPLKKYLPYVDTIARYPPDLGASHISFQIYKEALDGRSEYPNRFLYFATLNRPDDCRGDDQTQLVVKFTRRYCPDLHFFCAERGRAPKLLGYGMIPGGWHVVVMERIVQQRECYGRDRFQTWSQSLKTLVKEFHDEGWVHGDLRVSNLMIDHQKPEHIMLIDFDWGGNVNGGPVYYPTALLNKELEKPGNLDDLRITKEHDDRVLAITLDNLEKGITEGPEGTDPDL